MSPDMRPDMRMDLNLDISRGDEVRTRMVAAWFCARAICLLGWASAMTI